MKQISAKRKIKPETARATAITILLFDEELVDTAAADPSPGDGDGACGFDIGSRGCVVGAGFGASMG